MCDSNCGPGQRTRVRYTLPTTLHLTNPACSSFSYIEISSCTGLVTTCTTSGCTFGAWTGFSACSKACGGGTQYRTRTVSGASSCGPVLTMQLCNTQACV